MVLIRRFRPGDDLALNEVFHDATDPASHMARSLFREDSDQPPVTRCVVAELPGAHVLVGAASVAQSLAHPTRSWLHVEVAQAERARGLGTQLLDAVRQATQGTDLAGHPERVRVSADSVGYTVATRAGFTELFRTRVVKVEALALGGLGADRLEDFQVTATGSVALTQAFSQWYTGVNRADPVADMTLGQFNTRFLSEATGAFGAGLFKRDGDISAFAVSYPHRGAGNMGVPATRGGESSGVNDDVPATELTLGAMVEAHEAIPAPQSPDFQAALGDTGALLARLSTDTPVVVEVTTQMPVVTALIDGLLEAGRAQVMYEYVTLGLDS